MEYANIVFKHYLLMQVVRWLAEIYARVWYKMIAHCHFNSELSLMKLFKQFVLLFFVLVPLIPCVISLPWCGNWGGGLNLLMRFLQMVKHHKPFPITKSLHCIAFLLHFVVLWLQRYTRYTDARRRGSRTATICHLARSPLKCVWAPNPTFLQK